jgi:hypothetical protein
VGRVVDRDGRARVERPVERVAHVGRSDERPVVVAQVLEDLLVGLEPGVAVAIEWS